MRGKQVSMLGLLAGVLLTGMAQGAEVKRKDGAVLQGEIVSENEKEIVLSVDRKGMVARIAIPLVEIEHIDRTAKPPVPKIDKQDPPLPSVPRAYVLPMWGSVGTGITAAALEVGLAEARREKPDYVMLIIDTPGGKISEMEKIVDLLIANQDLNLVAYVRRGLSAGSVIAMACKTIVMEEGGTIGAAVPISVTAGQLPGVIEEKFNSAFRAKCRSNADRNGHSPLLMEGMIEPSLVLSLITKNGKTEVVEGQPDGGKVFKADGKILTLTASEAQRYGLSAGTCKTPESAKDALGLSAWTLVKGRGAAAMAQKSRENEAEQRYKEVKAEKEAKREEARRILLPQIAALQDQLMPIQARGRAAQDTLADVDGYYWSEIEAVEKDYKRAIRTVTPDPARLAAQAREIRDARLAEIERRYQPRFLRIREEINILKREQEVILEKLRPLQDELRKVEQR